MPPSVVVNFRPDAAVTVAVFASVAMTDVRSIDCGNETRRHDRPSADSRTIPAFPTSQQTDAEGAAPFEMTAGTPVD